MQNLVKKNLGLKVSGLSGLYCYFLLLTHEWMSKNGVAGWLIPSEVLDVNYGQQIKQYLLREVSLLHIHRFDPNDVQFSDALVSSVVVWFKNAHPKSGHRVIFSYGGSLITPQRARQVSLDTLAKEKKWTNFSKKNYRPPSKGIKIGDLFTIKRGLATGMNSYFILSKTELKRRKLSQAYFKPILPSPRYLSENEIKTDKDGNPEIEKKMFLLDAKLDENNVKKAYPTLWDYLLEGKKNGVHQRYLCKHRDPWYSQEYRDPAPIFCTYMARGKSKNGRSFRFILNHSKAIVANVYLYSDGIDLTVAPVGVSF